MEDICLDTDLLVNFLRNDEDAVNYVEENELVNNLFTTHITLFELYYGANLSSHKKQNIDAVDILTKRLGLLNLTERSVKKAGEISAELDKKGNMIDFRDLLIGTIALDKGIAIKTNNKKDFERIKGLKVV